MALVQSTKNANFWRPRMKSKLNLTKREDEIQLSFSIADINIMFCNAPRYIIYHHAICFNETSPCTQTIQGRAFLMSLSEIEMGNDAFNFKSIRQFEHAHYILCTLKLAP